MASGRSVAGWLAAISAVGGLIVVAAAAPAAPTAPGGGGAPGGLEPANGGAVTQNGASLYLQNCASCHGQHGEGTSSGPTLVGAGAAAADFYLRTGRMPLGAPGQRPIRKTPSFDEPEIEALVSRVASFGGGPAIPQVRAGGDVHRGWQLYTANCAACHAATGAGNAVGGGFVAVGLGHADDREIGAAMLVGPGAMPRFSFADDDRDAIVAYVQFLRSAATPGGAPIGGIGPVAEGFVSIVLGLTALVLIARFVGRRSHGDAVRPSGPSAAAGGPDLAGGGGE